MKLTFGCGYLGSRVARLWLGRGEPVAAVTRSPQRAVEFKAAGYVPFVADVTDRASLDAIRTLTQIDTVLYAVGFDRASNSSRRQVYIDGLRNTLDALPSGVDRLIFISTTGVYGQNDGSWIDEDSPCEPATESGRLFLEAEHLLQTHALANRALILRLAGLYGPGRIPRREDLLSGKPVPAAANAYLNVIHVDDAAQIILAVEAQAMPPRTYLVADGHPVQRSDYYAEAARLLSAPVPSFAPPTAEIPAQRGNTDKRANNARLTSEINFELRYPNYKQGLAASIDAEP